LSLYPNNLVTAKVEETLGHRPRADQEKVLHGNAERVYGIKVRHPSRSPPEPWSAERRPRRWRSAMNVQVPQSTDRVLDLDSHEMVPMELFEEVFGCTR